MRLHSPVQGLLWKCWRRSHLQLGLQPLLTLVIVSLIFLTIVDTTDTAAMNVGSRGFIFAGMFFLWAACPDIAYRLKQDIHIGFVFHMDFARPISTATLLATAIACQVALMLSAYLIPTFVLHVVFGTEAPNPLVLFLVVEAVILFSTIQWWATNSFATFVSFIAIAGLGWANWLFPPIETAADTASILVPPLSSFLLPSVLLAALLVLLYLAVQRQRQGESLFNFGSDGAARPAGMQFRVSRLVPQLGTSCPVDSPLRAAFWQERQLRGPLNLAFFGFCMALLTLVTVSALEFASGFIRTIDSGALLGIAAGYFFVPCLSIPAGLFGVDPYQGRARTSFFAYLRPMSTARLAAIKIAVVTTSLIVCGVVMAVTIVLLGPLFLADFAHYTADILLLWQTNWTYSGVESIAAGLLLLGYFSSGVLLCAVLVTWMMLYPRRLIWSMGGAGIYLLLLIVVSALNFPSGDAANIQPILQEILQAHLWLLVAGVPLLTIWCVREILARRILDRADASVIAVLMLLFVLLETGMTCSYQLDTSTPLAVELFIFLRAFLPLIALSLVLWTMGRIRHT